MTAMPTGGMGGMGGSGGGGGMDLSSMMGSFGGGDDKKKKKKAETEAASQEARAKFSRAIEGIMGSIGRNTNTDTRRSSSIGNIFKNRGV